MVDHPVNEKGVDQNDPPSDGENEYQTTHTNTAQFNCDLEYNLEQLGEAYKQATMQNCKKFARKSNLFSNKPAVNLLQKRLSGY